MIRSCSISLLLAGLAAGPVRADDSPGPLNLADLAAYRAALEPAGESAPPPVPATFRDLWDHPDRFHGRSVAVSGRLVRTFRQAAVGQFPPLTESWVTSPRGEPVCLVFPSGPANGSTAEVGTEVRFTGTFLRLITYQGGDAARVAPLLVGPAAPTPARDDASGGSAWGSLIRRDWDGDWLVGLVAVLGVGLILARRHLARPVRPPEVVGPAPRFVDGSDSEPDSDPLRFLDSEGDSHGDA